MREIEELRDKVKLWDRTTLEGAYINHCLALDYLNNELCEMRQENEQLKAENEQLKQALRKCSPIKEEFVWTGIGNEELENCIFCAGWKIYGKHDDDCHYVKLCGGAE